MANHIASISSSSRAIRQHEALDASWQGEARAGPESVHNQNDAAAELSTTSDLAKISVLSLSDDESLEPKTSTKMVRPRKKRVSGSNSQIVKPDMLSSKLAHLNSLDDIDSNFDLEELHHNKILDNVEQKWLEISKNLDSTMKHLEECSQQVTESSSSCLQALLESVGTTCDNVDGELKAFYHLMTKCDELTTKLSIATSFREEIKTLRKSVETLEQLYKNKPQAAATASLPNRL